MTDNTSEKKQEQVEKNGAIRTLRSSRTPRPTATK